MGQSSLCWFKKMQLKVCNKDFLVIHLFVLFSLCISSVSALINKILLKREVKNITANSASAFAYCFIARTLCKCLFMNNFIMDNIDLSKDSNLVENFEDLMTLRSNYLPTRGWCNSFSLFIREFPDVEITSADMESLDENKEMTESIVELVTRFLDVSQTKMAIFGPSSCSFYCGRMKKEESIQYHLSSTETMPDYRRFVAIICLQSNHFYLIIYDKLKSCLYYGSSLRDAVVVKNVECLSSILDFLDKKGNFVKLF